MRPGSRGFCEGTKAATGLRAELYGSSQGGGQRRKKTCRHEGFITIQMGKGNPSSGSERALILFHPRGGGRVPQKKGGDANV